MTDRKRPLKEANRLTCILDTLPPEERYPVDVSKVALELTPAFNDDPITKVHGDTFNTFEGALIRDPANPQWCILYNLNIQHPGRARFTVAHELGHYMLHRQDAGRDGFECGTTDRLRYDTGYTVLEEEADAFAACLLMPAHDFRRQVDNEPFGFDLLGHCANRYGVSLTSSVLRWLDVTSKRAIAVFSEDGYMHWAKSSPTAFKSRRNLQLAATLLRFHPHRWLQSKPSPSLPGMAFDMARASGSRMSRSSSTPSIQTSTKKR